MEYTDVAFVSAKSRGLSPDLKIVKDYLFNHLENVSFRYFTRNENAKNRYAKRGIKNANKEFCKNIQNVICIDGSLPTKLVAEAKQGNRIFISAPYDYQFKAMNEVLKGTIKKRNTYKNFTHLIAGSPFGKDLIKKCYKIPEGKIIDNVCCPVAWNLNQKEQQTAMREKFRNYFPDMKGKKILSILLTGKQNTKKNPYETYNWKALIHSLGEEWFVFTNNEGFIENTIQLSEKYRKSFGYVNQMLDARELLYFSDCIVTNSGLYASYFSSRKKPVYCVKHSNNEFEKYMRHCYPELYIEDLKKQENIRMITEKYSNRNKKFSEYFSYETSNNPCDEILRQLAD